jgi:hypothetical protein
MVLQFVLGSVMVLGLVLVVWMEMLKEKVSPWELDSRLAQELSLQRLQQEQYKRELDQLVQE